VWTVSDKENEMKKVFDQNIPETFADVDQVLQELMETERFPKEDSKYWALRHLLFLISNKCLNKIQQMEFMHKNELLMKDHGIEYVTIPNTK
jgi:hypothetical protein